MPDANQVISESESKMKKVIDSTKRDFAGIRTGRATTSLVEHIIELARAVF